MQVKRIAILFSGNGSNLEALINALHNKCFCASDLQNLQNLEAQEFLISGITNAFVECDCVGGGLKEGDLKEGAFQKDAFQKDAFKVEVVLALSNKKDAYGLVRAKNLGIKTQVLGSVAFKDRAEFDRELVLILKPLELDLCVLAGFMRILTPIFTNSIKAVNIHPSLLPLFKGANGMMESYQSQMKLGGVSVHYVSDELDSGEIIAQGVLVKKQKESLESYEARIHKLEHYLYPLAVLEVLWKQ
ncbi:phosphoribosylglycinamide formyltransferase [Helicobacter sp.]|uniref:phosphoribosylglycinamide formyltransferase n=1 Tax=Helicobacter sp. TaxID=218 RepID=UPI0025C1C360|nr:phosphoribosylglycinamide formyltransferase [Helicobacter sp.]MCI5968133.1 phosphoribosylglycinamide formyltransferase [Helicobacter sp.]MDY2585428.1 phosphoribosylglycinamide formyltransferase [Helicobacter sp.]